ncbi:MAG: arsenosugar biosynthesis radical SAM (seleno)protein ArsS [Phycisphaeraceae bacterium]
MNEGSPTISLDMLDTSTGGHAFEQCISREGDAQLSPFSIETVQVNIGLRCNLACHHCHVESTPKRTEEMDWPTMQAVLRAASAANAKNLDITGGAPEMHPHFAAFVDAALALGLRVMVRTNLTIMLDAGYEHLPGFFADRRIHLIASLPCYLESNVDRQRGKDVYRDSIHVIQKLNRQGYGNEALLALDLVYNPGGPNLPPPQDKLEVAYRRELMDRFGIRFTRLYTITNMAIGRFLDDLRRQGKAGDYLRLLRESFNPATLNGLMCRHQLHIGHDGAMYDCDFNYAIALPIRSQAKHIRDFDPNAFLRRTIATGEHCFGCTAGSGSSCQGALA